MPDEILELPRLPLGDWVDTAIRWVLATVPWLFDLISDVGGALIDSFEWVLHLPPPLLLAALVGLLGWRLRSWQFGLFTLVAFALIDSLGLWERTMDTLALIIIATFFAVLIGIPVGIVAARRDTVSTLVRPVLDFMQTLPVFVHLIPAVLLFGIGTVPGLVATVIFATPPAVRLTELGIRNVDSEVVEAAEAFGTSPNRILVRVQMPLAKPAIMQGVNQVIMLALSMVVVAGMIGAGGLGSAVYSAVTRIQIGAGFESGLAVVILAIVLDRLTSAIGQREREEEEGEDDADADTDASAAAPARTGSEED